MPGRVVERLPSLVQKKEATFKVALPAFLGMLLAGMFIANVPGLIGIMSLYSASSLHLVC